MRLRDLLQFNRIVVQCHDNPDADAIASGFGVYTYLKDNGKDARLVYGGRSRITKSNLCLMVSELEIPIEYVKELDKPELLVTVDCRYGEGNVTRFEAEQIAVIDHHQISGVLPELNVVHSNRGSCSTIVYELLHREGIDVNNDRRLATALYYGLMTDTNNFNEISHPADKDLRDDTAFDRRLIVRFRNANISLKELEIAGTALLGYDYNEEYRYAVVEAEPCDPNILGMISDFMLEVDAVDTCLIYSVLEYGVKLSVRSCIREVKANELAEYLVSGIGSGGGHLEKAGGFIQTELLDNSNADMPAGDVLKKRMENYFRESTIIYAEDYVADFTGMKRYRKKELKFGYVESLKLAPEGKNLIVRTLEGDLDVKIGADVFIMLGVKGEAYPISREKFERSYIRNDEEYVYPGEYEPVLKDVSDGGTIEIVPHAKTCMSTGEVIIFAKELDYRVKLFSRWDEERYMLGEPGDYLAVRADDHNDVYIIDKSVFDGSFLLLDK